MSFEKIFGWDHRTGETIAVLARRRVLRASRRRVDLRSMMESLEERSLLSSIVGQVIDDLNGNGLRDVGEAGVAGATVTLAQFDATTGTSTPITETTTDSSGNYTFGGLQAGTYLVSEPATTGVTQTIPTAEETAQSYLVQLGPGNDVAGGTLAAPLASPAANWLNSLPAQTYSIPLAADFLLQLGPGGTAPTRVFLTGDAQVQTQAPIVTTSTSGDGTTTTSATVNATMTSLNLVGMVSSDQNGQGYLGTITMTLTAPSSGQITSRSDSTTLVDSSFDVNATLQIPIAFGTPTVLHTAVPINLLAREIGSFPGFGGTYTHSGTLPPISLVDANNQEQGTLTFASLTPMPGLDFGNFNDAMIQGRAYIDANGDGTFDAGDTPLAGQAITLQKIAEVAGSTDESSDGSGAPPEGQGPSATTPITIYTDSSGLYSFSGLGPGGYTVVQPVGAPLTLVSPSGTDIQGYTIDAMTSGITLTDDFVNSFATGQINQSTAPDYPLASHTIVPNLHLGHTEFANASGQAYVNDGVTFGSALTPGGTVPLTIAVVVPAGQTAYLSGWLDADGSKTFSASEPIQLQGGGSLSDYVLTAPADQALVQTLKLNMVVPSNVSLSGGSLATYARFRLSTTSGLGPADPSGQTTAPDGEVEDLPVTIYDPSQLGTITGQTFEDRNGDGVMNIGEPGENGWTVNLVDLGTGQIVATQTSALHQTENGYYQFADVVPGHYEVQALPPPPTSWPAGATSVIVTAPVSPEGVMSYRIDVAPGDVIGTTPSTTTPASTGWLDSIAESTDSLFTHGEFTILPGGSGSGSGEPIQVSVVGNMDIYHGLISSGSLPAEITGLQLKGLAVSQSEEGGPINVLGPITVTLGVYYPSTGTIGPASTGETTGDVGSFALYASFDLTALGYGVVVNTQPINISGAVVQMPMVDTVLARSGGGTPLSLTDETTGAATMRLTSASLTTMFGLDQGDFYPGSVSGTVFIDPNKNNTLDSGEAGLAGAAVMVQQVVTEESSGSGGGETTLPLVYRTLTDANGQWSITDLGPGTYTVTEIPPVGYSPSGGASFSQSATIVSQGQNPGLNFGNYQVNQPPVIAAPTGVSTLEDSSLPFSTGLGGAISISDPDAGENPVQLSLSSPGGTISLSQTAGLTFNQGGATGSSQIVVTGSIASINAALATMSYNPAAHTNGAQSLTIGVNDQGFTGEGGAKTATATISIDVIAVADPPTLSVSGAQGNYGTPIPLGIAVARTNGAMSEVLSVTISGVPAGAWLSAGTNQGNGTWSLTPDQLSGLTLLGTASGSYVLTVTATATEPSDGSTASTVQQATITVLTAEGVPVNPPIILPIGPQTMAQVVIGDGTAQRSMIRSLTVAFPGTVNILPGAITLCDRLGRPVNLHVSTTTSNGQTVTTLTFIGRRIRGGSLWDGLYTLTINGSRIQNAATGQAVDAALNALAPAQLQFRRRFGDINGDGVVNRADFGPFRLALRHRAGQPGYLSAFDYNSNGVINAADRLQIRLRLQDWLREQDRLRQLDRLRTRRS